MFTYISCFPPHFLELFFALSPFPLRCIWSSLRCALLPQWFRCLLVYFSIYRNYRLPTQPMDLTGILLGTPLDFAYIVSLLEKTCFLKLTLYIVLRIVFRLGKLQNRISEFHELRTLRDNLLCQTGRPISAILLCSPRNKHRCSMHRENPSSSK